MKRIALALLLTMFCMPAFAASDDQDVDTWVKLTKDEKSALTDNLKTVPAQKVYILCNEDECKALAKSLKSSFKAAGWDVTVDRFPFSGMPKKGIRVWEVDTKKGNSFRIADMIEKSTNKRLKANPMKESLLDEKVADVVITIGEK